MKKKYYLIVRVIRADVPSASGRKFLSNYSIKLVFNGRSSSTSYKEDICSPVWNETFIFDTREQGLQGGSSSGDQSLEAYIYEHDVIPFHPKKKTDESDEQSRNSTTSLLGKVQLPWASFCNESAKAHDKSYVWAEKSYGTDQLPWLTKGTLVLRVFLADDDGEVQRETWARNNHAQILWSYVSKADEASLELADYVPKEMGTTLGNDTRYLFVSIVKARGLPDLDAKGSLDPYVEVRLGEKFRGVSKEVKRSKNPEWHTTLAFPLIDLGSPMVEVIVSDKDVVRDETVGKLWFPLARIPEHSPRDPPPEPVWHQLLDVQKQPVQGSLMLAIWTGSQAHPAYRHAWVCDNAGTAEISRLSRMPELSGISAKVHENPSLRLLRLTVCEAQGVAADGNARVARFKHVFVQARVGRQVQRTEAVRLTICSYVWDEQEELVFVAAEPFRDDDADRLEISVCTQPEHKVIGSVAIPLAALEKLAGAEHEWFDLQKPPGSSSHNNFMRIRLRIALGQHGHHAALHDPEPESYRQLRSQPPMGRLELRILGAMGLTPVEEFRGKPTLDPYCVARYGGKWARTRTLNAQPNPVFNAQYDWDVYDTDTVLTVGVFDDCLQLQRARPSFSCCMDARIGMVRIRLSGLETGRAYAHSYPLFVLSPSGVKRTGELMLAVRFSASASALSMIWRYCAPPMAEPKTHCAHPISGIQFDSVQYQALQSVLLRLAGTEPSIRKEALEGLCGVTTHAWSMRKSKANFLRIMRLISPLSSSARWFQDVCSWRYPLNTLLAHAAFVLALRFHTAILPLLLVAVAFAGALNYRRRPSCPQHLDLDLSQVGTATPEDLDEELHIDRTSRDLEVVRHRYDRLRSSAATLQEAVGALASHAERFQSLLRWRDARATAAFEIFALMAAIVLCLVPLKLLLGAAGFYAMRHPKLRGRGRNAPSFIVNFFVRLPSEEDCVL